MAIEPSAADARCVCTHSMAAHGLHGDAGCSFCNCRRFTRPAASGGPDASELGKYAASAFELLGRTQPFNSLAKEALLDFVRNGHGRLYAAGTYLIQAGERNNTLHVVLSGNVTVEPKDGAGLQCGPGEVVGDLRAFTEDPRWAGVYALDSVVALEIDVAKQRAVFNQYPELFMGMAQLLAKFGGSTEEVVNATVQAALEQHSADEAVQRREGLDPAKAMEISARWRQIKEEERARAAADRAREVAQKAIDRQTTRNH